MNKRLIFHFIEFFTRISVPKIFNFLRYTSLGAMGLMALLMSCDCDKTNGPDGTTPEITISPSGTMSTEVYQPTAFTATVKHNATYETQWLVNDDIKAMGDKYSHTITIEGAQDTLYAQAKDKKSGLTGKSSKAFLTGINSPAHATSQPGKASYQLGERATWTINAQDPTGIDTITIDFQNDGADTTITGNNNTQVQTSAGYTALNTGTLGGTITIKDRAGKEYTFPLTTVQITDIANVPPTATFDQTNYILVENGQITAILNTNDPDNRPSPLETWIMFQGNRTDNNQLTITANMLTPGEYPILGFAYDGADTAKAQATITRQEDQNHPPTLSIADVVAYIGATLPITWTGDDPDNDTLNVALYTNTTKDTLNALLLQAQLPESGSQNFNATAIPEGARYVVGVISDGKIKSVGYSNSFQVDHTKPYVDSNNLTNTFDPNNNIIIDLNDTNADGSNESIDEASIDIKLTQNGTDISIAHTFDPSNNTITLDTQGKLDYNTAYQLQLQANDSAGNTIKDDQYLVDFQTKQLLSLKDIDITFNEDESSQKYTLADLVTDPTVDGLVVQAVTDTNKIGVVYNSDKSIQFIGKNNYNTNEHSPTDITLYAIVNGTTVDKRTEQPTVTWMSDVNMKVMESIFETLQPGHKVEINGIEYTANNDGEITAQLGQGLQSVEVQPTDQFYGWKRNYTLNTGADQQLTDIILIGKGADFDLIAETDEAGYTGTTQPPEPVNWSWQHPEITYILVNPPDDDWIDLATNWVQQQMNQLDLKCRQTTRHTQTIYDTSMPEDSLGFKYGKGQYADYSIIWREIPKSGLNYTERDAEGKIHYGDVTIKRIFYLPGTPQRKSLLGQEVFQVFAPSPRDATKSQFPHYQDTFFGDDALVHLPQDWGNGPNGMANYQGQQIAVEILKTTLKLDHFYKYGNGVTWQPPFVIIPDKTIN